MNIIKNHLTEDQYFRDEHKKRQIYIHHTAGGPSAVNTIHGWQFNKERIGTAYVIDGSGAIYEAFEPKYWAYHLGLKTSNNYALNMSSIGIEVCNWGQLIFRDGKFWNYINKEVPKEQVEELSSAYRGFQYYHKYNDAQLKSLKELLVSLCNNFNISKGYHSSMFDINQDALNGEAGIWTHTSVRTDKVDCSPQKNLIQMLSSI